MVKKHVRVYIEGGAEGKTADNDFRRGWKKFLNELHELARENGFQSLEIVRGLGRGNAFKKFKAHQIEHPNDLCVLLVDSETEVAKGTPVWDVVAQREGDKWERPEWATEQHLYLMVVMVETWLLTDQDALHAFFDTRHNKCFNTKNLPTTNLEERSKDEINGALHQATKECKKGFYKHGQAHEIIELVQPGRVKTLSHGLRLFKELGELIKASP